MEARPARIITHQELRASNQNISESQLVLSLGQRIELPGEDTETQLGRRPRLTGKPPKSLQRVPMVMLAKCPTLLVYGERPAPPGAPPFAMDFGFASGRPEGAAGSGAEAQP